MLILNPVQLFIFKVSHLDARWRFFTLDAKSPILATSSGVYAKLISIKIIRPSSGDLWCNAGVYVRPETEEGKKQRDYLPFIFVA